MLNHPLPRPPLCTTDCLTVCRGLCAFFETYSCIYQQVWILLSICLDKTGKGLPFCRILLLLTDCCRSTISTVISSHALSFSCRSKRQQRVCQSICRTYLLWLLFVIASYRLAISAVISGHAALKYLKAERIAKNVEIHSTAAREDQTRHDQKTANEDTHLLPKTKERKRVVTHRMWCILCSRKSSWHPPTELSWTNKKEERHLSSHARRRSRVVRLTEYAVIVDHLYMYPQAFIGIQTKQQTSDRYHLQEGLPLPHSPNFHGLPTPHLGHPLAQRGNTDFAGNRDGCGQSYIGSLVVMALPENWITLLVICLVIPLSQRS